MLQIKCFFVCIKLTVQMHYLRNTSIETFGNEKMLYVVRKVVTGEICSLVLGFSPNILRFDPIISTRFVKILHFV